MNRLLHPTVSLGLSLTAMSCTDLPELSYETEHLLIGTEYDAPLCRGNLEHLERVVTTLETLLDTRVDTPVEVYIWDPLREEGPGWCSNNYSLGCYSKGKVYTDLISLDHELVHAVVATLGKPAPFWAEGSAEALQSSRTLFGPSAPADNLELDTPTLSYLSAGHFARWLFETHGAASYRALLAERGGAREVFERVYAMSFEDAQAQFFAQAPYSYGALVSCEHPQLPLTGALEWFEVLDVDCAGDDVYSTPLGMGAFRVLTITEPGYYTVSTSAEIGTLARCDDEALSLPPVSGDPAHGDVPPTTDAAIFQYQRGLAGGGELHDIFLVPGRYEVAAGFRDFEARDATLEIVAAPGPVPQLPGGS